MTDLKTIREALDAMQQMINAAAHFSEVSKNPLLGMDSVLAEGKLDKALAHLDAIENELKAGSKALNIEPIERTTSAAPVNEVVAGIEKRLRAASWEDRRPGMGTMDAVFVDDVIAEVRAALQEPSQQGEGL